MRALVVGSTGSVGTHLMRRLEQPVARFDPSLEKIRQRLGDVGRRGVRIRSGAADLPCFFHSNDNDVWFQ